MASRTRRSVIVLEDERTLAKTMHEKLEKSGYKVQIEIDGVLGLQRIQKVKPDIVLLDCILPGLSGVDVLRALRAKPSTRAIKVIMLSNVDDEKIKKEALRLGALDYFIKTQVSLAKIIEEIEKALA
ncbi:MAG: response regulator [Patescibacteria group bacterium]